jgi:hypothetical protein
MSASAQTPVCSNFIPRSIVRKNKCKNCGQPLQSHAPTGLPSHNHQQSKSPSNTESQSNVEKKPDGKKFFTFKKAEKTTTPSPTSTTPSSNVISSGTKPNTTLSSSGQSTPTPIIPDSRLVKANSNSAVKKFDPVPSPTIPQNSNNSAANNANKQSGNQIIDQSKKGTLFCFLILFEICFKIFCFLILFQLF